MTKNTMTTRDALKILRNMKILLSYIAISLFTVLFSGCSRPAKQYGNEILRKHADLNTALAAFCEEPNTVKNSQAVVYSLLHLRNQIQLVDKKVVADIRKMSPDEASAWAQNVEDHLEPIRKQILETMARVRGKITSDKNAPIYTMRTTKSDMVGDPSVGVEHSYPAYKVGDGFYFTMGDNEYNVERFIASYHCRAILRGLYTGDSVVPSLDAKTP